MKTRSEEEIIEEIRATHTKLDNLHEELFNKLNISETITDKASTDQEKRNKDLQVGDQVEVLTKGIGANKGDTATVTKITKSKIGIIINKNGRNTHRLPQNLKPIRTADQA